MERRQAHLRELLAADTPDFAVRPPTGNWSVLENLQHLAFAEQAHFRRYLADPQPWNKFALPNSGSPAAKGTGVLAANAAEVFQEWAKVHEETMTLVDNNDPRLVNRLERHLRHLNAHTRVIERLLKAPGQPRV